MDVLGGCVNFVVSFLLLEDGVFFLAPLDSVSVTALACGSIVTSSRGVCAGSSIGAADEVSVVKRLMTVLRLLRFS